MENYIVKGEDKKLEMKTKKLSNPPKKFDGRPWLYVNFKLSYKL